MKKIYSFIFFVVLSGLFAHADPLSPRNDQVCLRLDNNIQLIIDERIELVCTVFRLAGAQEYINYQLFDYISEVDDFVYNNKDHPIISFIKDIRDNYNFAYSIAAKSALMVKIVNGNVVYDNAWNLKKTFSEEYEQCWTEDIFREYVGLLDDFYKKSNFHLFFISHFQFYEKIVEESAKTISKINVPVLEQYYQRRVFPVDLYLGLSTGNNNYSIPGINNQKQWNKHLAIVIGVEYENNSVPSISNNQIYTIVHEISHFFVSPLIEKTFRHFSSEMETVFSVVKNDMYSLGYSSARSVAGEWINEIFSIRYFIATAEDKNNIDEYIAENEERGFIWFGKAIDETILNCHENSVSESLSKIIQFAKSLPSRWETIQAEYLSKKPFIIDIQPSFKEISSNTKMIKVIFSESMMMGISGMLKLPDYPMIPAEFPSCHWENDTTFVIKLNSDMLISENEFGVRFPYYSFVSKTHYRMKDNYDMIFKVQ